MGMSGGGVSLSKRTKEQLYELAKRYKIVGRSKMNKGELIEAIRSHHDMIGKLMSKRGRR